MATKKELAAKLAEANEEIEKLRAEMEAAEDAFQREKDDFQDELTKKYADDYAAKDDTIAQLEQKLVEDAARLAQEYGAEIENLKYELLQEQVGRSRSCSWSCKPTRAITPTKS